MKQEEVMTELADLVSGIRDTEVDPNKPELRLVEDLEADSMDVVEICDKLEMKFGFEVATEEIENVQTMGDLRDLVLNKQVESA